jgi:hypothetical protein
MGEFFKGRRRKLGAVTLLMALVFMGGWVRSLYIMDTFAFSRMPKELLLVSVDGVVGWQTFSKTDIGSLFDEFRWHAQKPKSIDDIFNHAKSLNKWRWNGFGVMQLDNSTTLGCIPYWSIVIPLTLLSSFLLLIKPHKSIQEKTSEPISTEGT